jgi:hypothetical protein
MPIQLLEGKGYDTVQYGGAEAKEQHLLRPTRARLEATLWQLVQDEQSQTQES